MDSIGGQVSYTTSQNIYVRFISTSGIEAGDTLFQMQNGNVLPVLEVKHLSSTSCVTTLIGKSEIEIGTEVFALKEKKKSKPVIETPVVEERPPDIVMPAPVKDEEEEVEKEAGRSRKTESLTGRFSVATYSNFYGEPDRNKQRMRYTLSMNANQIGNTKLSAETYISFRHTINEWQEVKDNFGRAFKVYNLALHYKPNDQLSVWAGRKINYNMANVGAIDGLQAEKRWNKIFTGAFAGSRPDHQDYGFNFDLLQFGLYTGYKSDTKNGSIQSTLAVAEQRNGAMTDRRFAYFQHVNSSIKRIYIFTSFEFDLYTLEDGEPKSTFDVTGLYASIRYKPFDKLSLFGSYDARKNIIYYETYKNFLDQLLEDETRQGFRFNFNYRPLKRITIGSSAGYRFQKGDPASSKNVYSYLTIAKIPKVDLSATLSVIWMQSAYLDGLIYGVRASRSFVKGKLYAEAQYRKVEYNYRYTEFPLVHSIAGANLSWRFSRKFSLSVNYEGEIRDKEIFHSVYTNIVQRF